MRKRYPQIKTYVAAAYLLVLCVLCGCTDYFMPYGNGEAYSGNRPPKPGTYYQVDTRVSCPNTGGAISGYRAILEVISETQVAYRGACETQSVDVKVSDLLVSELGHGTLAQRDPMISYQGLPFDPMSSPPSATSTDRVSTRSWCRSTAGPLRYDVVVRAAGTAESPTLAKAFILASNLSSATSEIIAEIPVAAISVNSSSRAYSSDNFDLRLNHTGTTTAGILNAMVGGNNLSLSSLTCDDTFLLPPPPPITRPLDVLAAGDSFSCAARLGTPYCWGRGDSGQLGTGAMLNASVPTPLASLTSGVTAIATGQSHACAIQSGKVFCWGTNGTGQLGDGTFLPRSVPAQASFLTQADSVATGGAHTCAIQAKRVYCWGENTGGELGIGTNVGETTPQLVSALSEDVASVVAGATHTCALTAKGEAYCWGYNSLGQLGINPLPSGSFNLPQKITTARFVSLSAGGNISCGVTELGRVACWGDNANASVSGDGAPSTVVGLPLIISSIAGPVTAVSAGYTHSCAIQTGSLLCWGGNTWGQMGQGGTSIFSPVVGVPTLSGVLAIAAGNSHTLSRSLTAFQSWGDNSYGQLGDGTQSMRTSPVPFFFP